MAKMRFNNVYLEDYITLAGPEEYKGKIKNYNIVLKDFYYGMNTFEQAEIKMQKTVIEEIMNKNRLKDEDVNYLIGGDLINQISISSYAAKEFKIPFIGIYSACSTFTESLIVASVLVENKYASKTLCVTSSHNLTAERQFRYPVEYGYTRPQTSTTTATGAACSLVSNKVGKYKIVAATIGKIVDLGINDVNHMGAVMAPACADSLHEHLKNNKQKLQDYDLILTGDLGCVGVDILCQYYEKVYGEKINNIIDSGCELYLPNQDVGSGGSGPACLPLYLFTKVLKNKKYHHILILGTGSLHSPVLVNQHQTIPSISHAVEIEVIS